LSLTAAQIEFPSILLPPDIHSGSIVDINVSRNQHAELIAEQKFNALQREIYTTFGTETPSPPVLRCRNTTQTSVVLEWDPIHLATAELRSLSLYRNGTKAGVIPRDKLSTKISGLALDTEYTFHLVLRTSAGQYSSERLTIKTHKMTDLTGITITPGVMPSQLKDSLAETVNKIGAKMIDSVRIDTTHFVCTEPRGQAWEKAVEMNVPVVVPDWVKGCEREGRIVGVRGYYLDADPRLRQMGPSQSQQVLAAQRLSIRDSPRIEHTPPTPDRPQPEANGAPSVTSEPATPPAHPAEERPSPEGSPEPDHRSTMTGTTVTAQEAEDSDEESDDESEATQKVSTDSAQPATKGKGKEETDGGNNASVAEEDKFDEVTL
jgi:chitin biosynthesis protein CHS5